MAITIQARVMNKTATLAQWTTENPVLLKGEIAIVIDGTVKKIKIGDGTAAFLSLPYITMDASFQGLAIPATDPGPAIGNRYWLSNGAGTYTHFSGIVIAANEVAYLIDNGTGFVKNTLPFDFSSYLTVSNLGIQSETQIFDKTAVIVDSYVNSSGVLSISAGFNAASFPVDQTKANITFSGFTPNGSPNKYAAFYNSSNAIVGSVITMNAVTKTLAIPVGAVGIRLTVKNGTEANTVLDTIMVNYGTSALPYESYISSVVSISGKKIRNADKDVYTKDQVNILIPSFGTVSSGVNMADPTKIIADSYISTTSFLVTSAANWQRQDYIAVIPGQQYWISGLPSSTSKAIQYADANKVKLTATPGALISGLPFTFTAPAGCFYVTFTTKRDTDTASSSIMFNTGASALPYEPFDPSVAVQTINGNQIMAKALAAGATLNGEQIATVDMLGDQGKIVPSVKVYRSGDNYYVRTRFDDTRDLVQKNSYAYDNPNNQNTSFDFWGAWLIDKASPDTPSIYESGQLLKSGRDDVAPLNTLSHGHLGEGHGLSCAQITATAHGKTSADIMSRWAESGGSHVFRLAIIVDANTLIFVCEPYNITGPGGAETATTGTVVGTTLTHISGATNTGTITIGSQVAVQQYPVHFNRINKVFIDGQEITTDGLFLGYQTKFTSEYDIADPCAYTYTTPWSFDKGPSFVRMQVNYIYQPNGACVVFHSVNFLRQKTLNFWYALQATKLSPSGAYTRIFSMVPKVNAVGGLDYKNIVETTTTPAETNFTTADLIDVNHPPDRHIQFFSGADGVKKIGFAMGFSTDMGISKDSIRKSNSVYWQLASTGKSYPRILVDYPATNQAIFNIGYRTFFNAEKIGSATSAYSYNVGNSTYLVIDFLGTKTKTTVPVAYSLCGKKIEVIEKTGTLTLLSVDFVPAAGIMVTCTGNNDYIILKLT